MRRRVVVTGLGCVSPVGNSVAESWSNLLAGRSGIDTITSFDTTGSLHDRLAVLGGRLIVEALERAAHGLLMPSPQPATGVTYAHKIDKQEATIDWSQPASLIARRLRAFDPFPGATSRLGAEIVKLWSSEIDSELSLPDKDFGTILSVNPDGVRIVVPSAFT